MGKISENESKTIDLLKLILAFMVVAIHCFSLYKYNNSVDVFYYDSNIYDFIRIFIVQCLCRLAVPTFFIISGFLFFYNFRKWECDKYKNKIKNRFQTLFVPYLFWNLISFFSIFGLEYLAENGLNFDLLVSSLENFLVKHGFLRVLWDNNCVDLVGVENILGYKVYSGGPINLPLWFMRDLLILSLLTPLILFFLKKYSKLFLLIIGGLMVFNIWLPFTFITPTGLFFYTLGGYLAFKNSIYLSLAAPARLFLMLLNILLMIFVVITYNYNPLLYGILLKVFTIIGSLSIVNLVYYFVSKFKINNRFDYSPFSFFIFVTHYNIFLPISYIVINKLSPNRGEFDCILNFFITIFLIILLSYIVWYFLCKTNNKYILSLIGKRR